MTEHVLACVTTTFPDGALPQELLPEGTTLHSVSKVEGLAAGEPASAVLLFAGSSSGVACPALQQLHRLRTSSALSAEARSSPVLILSDYSAEDLLRLDPSFLPFVSPGTVVLSPPFSKERVHEALRRVRPADPETVTRYLDIEGQLAKLRDRARHRVANALGPQVLVESARAGGAMNADRAEQVSSRLARLGPPDPVASEYAELLSLVRIAKTGAAAKFREPFLELQKDRLNVLLLDDDRTAGWPEALAGVLNLGESAPLCPDLTCRGFSRGAFRLDCWAGTDLDALLNNLCPAIESGVYVELPYDAVLLDLRLENESAELPTEKLSGYRALKRIHAIDPSVQVVLFTASKNALHVREMLNLEVAGYYPKEDSLPEPPVANWGRLRDALLTVTRNLYRRCAFWALSAALGHAAGQDWYQRASDEQVEKLSQYVDHLQALIFLRETALPDPLEVRMKRHFIDSAHAVMDATLRMRHQHLPWDTKTVDLVKHLPYRSAVRQAAFWLNETRNKTVHANRSDDIGDPHDHFVAISAACMVLSDGLVNASEVLERIPRHYWPQWK